MIPDHLRKSTPHSVSSSSETLSNSQETIDTLLSKDSLEARGEVMQLVQELKLIDLDVYHKLVVHVVAKVKADHL